MIIEGFATDGVFQTWNKEPLFELDLASKLKGPSRPYNGSAQLLFRRRLVPDAGMVNIQEEVEKCFQLLPKGITVIRGVHLMADTPGLFACDVGNNGTVFILIRYMGIAQATEINVGVVV